MQEAQKIIRPWAYAIMIRDNMILLVKKTQGPYEWMLDLPWWKIEHWEHTLESLKRELHEEIWAFNLNNIQLLWTYTQFTHHEWQWQKYHMHLLWIVYVVTDFALWDHTWDGEDNDVDGYEWVPLSTINDYNTTPLVKDAIREYKEKYLFHTS
jgi:ADP-ribose pyrophosphatase YjhB (NUDIX family)